MSNAWDWVNEFAMEAAARDDAQRLRLVDLMSEAYSVHDIDTPRSLELYREGIRLSEMLGEPWMRLLYSHWYVNIKLHCSGDCRDILDLAMANVLEVRKPSYETFPGRFPIYIDLVCAYLGIDPAGYESQLRELLAFLDTLVGPDEEDEQPYLEMQKARLGLKLGRIDEAEEAGLRMLEMSEGRFESTYSAYSHCILCRVAFRKQDFEGLEEWAIQGQLRSRLAGERKHRTVMEVWQALCLRRRGEDKEARRLYRRAREHASRWTGLLYGGLFNACSAFHELNGEWEQILEVRDWHVNHVLNMGRHHDESWSRNRRCEALARLDRLSQQDVEDARQAALRLRKPEAALADLERVCSA